MMQRTALLGLGALALSMSGSPALAEGKPLPPPATDAVPPVELRIGLTDGKATCSPAELPLPADTNIELHLTSTADRPVTLTIPGQFEKGRVLHSEGDVVHVASEKGYTVKANGKGVLRLRSLPPGEVSFACTSSANMSAPFTGKVVLARPAD